MFRESWLDGGEEWDTTEDINHPVELKKKKKHIRTNNKEKYKYQSLYRLESWDWARKRDR